MIHLEEIAPGVVCEVLCEGSSADTAAPPLVFLPGLLGQNRHWAGVSSGLAGVSERVCIQLPYTELAREQCSIEGLVEITAALLRRHVGRPAVLVGNSMGGHVVARLALDHPELVAGLVLAGASGLREKASVFDFTMSPSRQWLVSRFGVMFHEPEKHVTSQEIEMAHGMLCRREAVRAFVRLSRSSRDDHLGDRLARISTPTLVLWGRQDVVTPPEAAEMFASGIPGAELVWMDRCGHAPMIEQPEVFAAEVARFCWRLPPTSGALDAANWLG